MREKATLPLLLQMSIPVVLSMLIQSLYNIVDGIWVTRLGTDALTAVSLAFPMQNAIMSVGVGLGVGMGAIVSQRLGAGDREGASRSASLGMVLVLVSCVLFFLVGLFLTKPFLRMFTDDPQIFQWATEYTTIVLCFSFGELLQMGYEKVFQSAGKMLTSMFFMAAAAVINIILDPILIFGLCGFPAMGVTGAAIATVIGQIVGMLLYLFIYQFKDIGLHIHPRFARWDGKLAGRICSVGLPCALTLAMPSVMTGIINGILVELGSIYVAVFGLYFKLQGFINMPANGIVQGLRPIIGYNYGAGDQKRVRQTTYWAMMLIGIIMAIGTILAVFCPRQVLQLFDAEPALMQEGTTALRIIGSSFLLSTVSTVSCGVFEALGKGPASLMVSLLRQLVLLVPLAWILSRFWGAIGIWTAFPIAELLTMFAALWRLRHSYVFETQKDRAKL